LIFPKFTSTWTSAKWTLGLLWEGKISFLDFSFPNRNQRLENNWRQFFQEIEEYDFLEGAPNAILSRLTTQEYRPNVHFAEVQFYRYEQGRRSF